MLKQEITIEIIHPDYCYARPELIKKIQISHNNTNYSLWYPIHYFYIVCILSVV